MAGLLDPDIIEVSQGQAEVRATFKVPKAGTIAGCYVTDGMVSNRSNVRVVRDGVVVHEANVKEVAQGYECGIGLENYNDIKDGDIFEFFTFKEVKREL